MSITSIIRPFFRSRYRAIERYGTHAEEIQRKVLAHLLQRAADTEWGKRYGYESMRNYEDFAKKVPVNTYEELKGYIDRMRHGENHVLWPGQVNGMPNRRAQPTIKASLFPSAAKACTIRTMPADRMP